MARSDVLITTGRAIIAFIGYGFTLSVLAALLLMWICLAFNGLRGSTDNPVALTGQGLIMAFVSALVTTALLRVLS